MAKALNANCTIKLKVVSATFLKDADTFGKQDPFVKIPHGGKTYKTEVIDEGGKTPVWNEEFELEFVEKEVKGGGSLILNTFDSDGAVDEFLGGTKPIKYTDLIKNGDV